MSTRFRFYIGEAVRSLRANLATTLAATVTVLIVMFFLGVFVALGSYLYAKVDQVRSETKVSVYLKDDALKTPEVQSVLRNAGIDPLGGTPGDFAELIQAEIEKWTKVAKAAGLSK